MCKVKTVAFTLDHMMTTLISESRAELPIRATGNFLITINPDKIRDVGW